MRYVRRLCVSLACVELTKHSLYLPSYPVCECPPHYKGPHCEFLDIDASVNDNGSSIFSDFEPERDAGMVALLVFLAGTFLVISLVVGRQFRRHFQKREGATINLQGFRDEDMAISPNGSMLFPAFSPNDSGVLSGSGRSHSSRNRSGRSRLSRSRSGRFT
jgi:hypothetical protein